ncbi:NAD(P)/FAD-dependent oxidoreductase [Mycobacterium sp. CBMA271]|uniref:NAD(P)/FAD-dependent oxidoreductase n=1 Tax=unclassified Mycobacteroides TaxID=2618759 RepID=UPI0012DEC818|nr:MULTISPECIES: FAD/NAD(P)-binding oxidoreductase [unclassified Mycobacteroides]MUM15619.1 dehydrogenase [Mycobacteroides sp. CBMA 326]MUM17414.1 dehydrogenase [Mycobacteroides sp. CBMA 326]MUM21889.1 NAD(P)/FAD-dependent oxidoreductase [Mycobacteroides sp. CBMA 271]
MPKTIVVIGAGIGGLSVIEELNALNVQALGHQVLLVDEARSHTQGLSLPWVMRGWRRPEEVAVTPSAVALDGIDRIRAAVAAVDPERRVVMLDTGEDLEYHALVIAAGARNNLGLLPGLPEAYESGNAVHFYAPDAARQAHHALDSFTDGRVIFLVTSTPYRCPVAPVEGALLAADLFSEAGIRDHVAIDLYTPEPHPLVSAGPVVGAQMITMLEAAGIGFHGSRTPTAIHPHERRILFADGVTEPFDLLVFVPPHEPALAVGDHRGWIPANPATLETHWPGVWALGDIASVTAPSGKLVPKAATFAKSQAAAVASQIIGHLSDDLSDRDHLFHGRGECFVEVGAHRSGLAHIDFFALPAPRLLLSEPSEELHERKQREESEWIHRWQR